MSSALHGCFNSSQIGALHKAKPPWSWSLLLRDSPALGGEGEWSSHVRGATGVCCACNLTSPLCFEAADSGWAELSEVAEILGVRITQTSMPCWAGNSSSVEGGGQQRGEELGTLRTARVLQMWNSLPLGGPFHPKHNPSATWTRKGSWGCRSCYRCPFQAHGQGGEGRASPCWGCSVRESQALLFFHASSWSLLLLPRARISVLASTAFPFLFLPKSASVLHTKMLGVGEKEQPKR